MTGKLALQRKKRIVELKEIIGHLEMRNKALSKDIREGKKEMAFLIKLLHDDQLHDYNDWLLLNASETRKAERPRV